ncbi:unnamed protein product [Cuscuta europaea]|nr:unnamed protein product [Cuscuta europaea]
MKQKAMKTVSGISGLESIAMDRQDKKLTIIGDIDPVKVVAMLRKFCRTEIFSVGPAKEEEKKKTEEPKKGEEKKKGGDPKKQDGGKQEVVQLPPMPYQYHPYYYQQQQRQPYYNTQYPPSAYHNATSVEEDPNSCVIC